MKVPALAVLMLLLVGAAVACSDDGDDVSPEEAYCNSGESLQESLEALLNVNPIEEGTSGVETAINNVESNISEFTDAAKEVTEDEAQAVEDAFNDLKSAFEALGDEGISIDNGAAVIDALTALAPPAEAMFATLTETC